MQQVLWRIPIHPNWAPDGIPIYGFGMMLFLAFIVCTWLAGRRAERAGIPNGKEVVQDFAIWVFLGGLLGARILYLVAEEPPMTFVEYVEKLPKIWDGGIVLYGSILGGIAAYAIAYYVSFPFWTAFRKRGISTLKLADVIAPSIAVGLALGRVGCFLNGCCYGQVACPGAPVYPVHFPLSAPARYALVEAGDQTAAGFTLDERYNGPGAKVGRVDPDSAAAAAGLETGQIIIKADGRDITGPGGLVKYLGSFQEMPRGEKTLTLEVEGRQPLTCTPLTIGLHPTQLYETTSMLLLLLLLLAYEPFKTRDGQVMVLLMLAYAVHRYLNELLRNDPRPVGFERYASVVLFAAGLILLLGLYLKPAQYRPRWMTA